MWTFVGESDDQGDQKENPANRGPKHIGSSYLSVFYEEMSLGLAWGARVCFFLCLFSSALGQPLVYSDTAATQVMPS